MTLATGTKLGHYEIRSKIGEGGMDEVYLAQDTELGRTVAIKILPEALASDQQRLQRFIQEAKAASALNHPHILTIYEIGTTGASRFIATEFIDGETLRQHIRNAPMKLGEVLDVATQITSALSAAHAAGIVHRDIKPENIMLRSDGYIKVLDFGLAKLSEPVDKKGANQSEAPTRALVNTEKGVVMGTAKYMSPEQSRGLQVDERTDIWSLGVVLYEMVTRHVPFDGATHSDVIVSILDREPPPLAKHVPGIPAELQRIVRKALRKDREERYQTVKDMALDLKNLRREMDVEAELERLVQPVSTGAAQSGSGPSVVTTATVNQSAADTAAVAEARPTSSVEYVVNEIKRHKQGAAIIVAILIIALGGFGYTIYRFINQDKSKPVGSLQNMKMARLTNTGKASEAAISPDGKYVVHVVDDGGQQSLWVRQVAPSNSVQIIPPAGVHYLGLTFSHDGSSLYYVVREKNNAQGVLYQMPVLGGVVRKLMSWVDSPITFSPDGKRFAFVRTNYPSPLERVLMIANADGTGEQKLATRKRPDYFRNSGPAWSPDGKVIACVVGSSDTTNWHQYIVEVRVADETEKQISSQRWFEIERIAWLPDGSALLMSIIDRASLANQIWQLSYPGGELERITNDLNSYTGLSLSVDSNSLVTVQSGQIANIWTTLSEKEASNTKQITFGGAKLDGWGGLSWAPGGRIVYSSNGSGRPDIWIVEADGTGQKQLTTGALNNIWPSVCLDGRYIVYMSDRTGSPHVWRMDVDGGNPRQLTNGNGEFNPNCSPNGRWVVYTSAGSAKRTLWKVPIDGGDPVQLTERHSEMPFVSPDGKLIACSYQNAPNSPWKIAVIPFDGGQPIKTFDVSPSVDLPAYVCWTFNGQALTYADTRDSISNLWSQSFDGTPPKQLTNFTSDRIFWFDFSPDGKRLALSRGMQARDVVLISGFK